jgi:hypothetical protein
VLVLAGIPYLLVFSAAAFTHWPRKWYLGPDLDSVYERVQRTAEGDMITNLIAVFAKCDQLNQGKMGGRLKPWALRLAGGALLAETAVVAVGLALLAL